jgi:acyl-coenzyme A thioesterase PaaI-like protein
MHPLPPYAQLLGLRIDDVDGECRLMMPFSEDVVGRPGFLHGGAHDTFASARIQRLGSRMANVEATAWQSDRATPIAGARLNFLLKRPAQ